MSLGEHTSKEIIGTKGNELSGKKIVIGVTGSVAAIKSPEIARELMRYGAEVYTVMSQMAQKVIHPHMMEWSTGNPVVTELTGETEHITLGGEHLHRADLILVAPTTANTIGKAATAIDDTPITTLLTTAIGTGISIIMVPAMHASMYRHPIVMKNVEKLRSIGVKVLIPRFEEGMAKISTTEEIVEAVISKLTVRRDYQGVRVLITAGPTREYLDGFRFITNPSSGKMGIAIARDALERGGEVTLVYGPGSAEPPTGAKVIPVETTTEMLDAVLEELKSSQYNLAVLSAAAADFGIKERDMVKTSSGSGSWRIDLIARPKIIDRVKKVRPKIFLVGFKAEYNVSDEDLIKKAQTRMETGGMDLIVANDVARTKVGFGHETNEAFIIDKKGSYEHLTLREKEKIASRLLTIVKSKMCMK
ncbi:MAG: bifunctional phosphopantothenoylcysteine decarboxylase/phosphopantothenate--cysteine ligase CoaBC [Candidatus Bathyarchaeota archaeon]|jgi:phosphopantothenoylcysteine decarboxylase/phosphopantothenate--cysteine ligase|nr:bifunctional phosphopantothenoylcysteine decarboxylase/phosphopantothenate--cysteine ligase CoaBC [Candidatus Bathyarchaeota archaeon]